MVLLVGCTCDSDEYGNELILVVPVETIVQDTMHIGDTIWIKSNFSNIVEVQGHDRGILLEHFDFFTEFGIGRIIDSMFVSYNLINSITIEGSISRLELATVVVYPITYHESDTGYSFHFGIVLDRIGVHAFQFASYNLSYEDYDHPATYLCNNTKREKIDVQYQNDLSNPDNYIWLYPMLSEKYLAPRNNNYENYHFYGTYGFVVIP